MRKFQIRDVGSDGCGSFYYFEVENNATNEHIYELAEKTANENKLRQENNCRYSFYSSVKYRPTLKVVEIVKKYFPKRTKEELEYAKQNNFKYAEFEWITKRNGLKFNLKNQWIEFTYNNGTKERINGYKVSV